MDAEFNELVQASRIAAQVKHPFRNHMKRRNRPQLIITICLQIFQQLIGINAIMFYALVLFQTLGFKSDASLYSAVITGAVNVISTIISIYSVDKIGRRVLLLEAGVQMSIAQVAQFLNFFSDFHLTAPFILVSCSFQCQNHEYCVKFQVVIGILLATGLKDG